MKPNAEIFTTSVTQSANELLGKKEQKLFYLIVKTAKGALTINVGQKTHDEVQRLTEVVTSIQIAPPEPEQQPNGIIETARKNETKIRQ